MIDQIHLSWMGDPATTMTFRWHSNIGGGNPRVLVTGDSHGPVEVSGSRHDSPGDGYLFTAQASALRPGTSYDYRVVSDHEESPTYSFTTIEDPVRSDLVFAFFTDTGLIGRPDGNATGTTRVYRELVKAQPRFLLGGGDYAYANRDGRFERVCDAVDEWFNQAQPVIARSPFFPQFGNHEAELLERFEDWQPRFALPRPTDGGRCYSFSVGGLFIVSLYAPSHRVAPEHVAWLEAQLRSEARKRADFTIVYHHEAIYSHGNSHPTSLPVRHALAPLYDEHGVDLVLNGHDQNYERTYPLREIPHDPTPGSDSRDEYRRGDGVVFAKVSPAGKKSEIGNTFSRFVTKQHAYVAARDDTRHHYALLTYSPGRSIVVYVYGLASDEAELELVDRFTIRA
ncbi:MAG: purple acid phosphatase family protein [Spirochaetota bacterium]